MKFSKEGETLVPGQEPELAPGVRGYALEVDGDIWIPLIIAKDEGSGAVGKFIDELPVDRRIVFPNVLSLRLASMLRRRGFVLTVDEVTHLFIRESNTQRA